MVFLDLQCARTALLLCSVVLLCVARGPDAEQRREASVRYLSLWAKEQQRWM